MGVMLALYKGPPRNDWMHTASHYGIRLWTWSKWSHAEIVIDGWCYSASARDSGVRRKQIDLSSGRWDLVSLPLTEQEISRALAWFLRHEDDLYDYWNIGRFILPIIGHERYQWVCFESIGAALGLAAPQKLTANDLFRWAEMRQSSVFADNQPIFEGDI